ncbi:class I adenylate-forming enzyme family protein [Streptomyces sp. NPDC055140]
MDFGKKGPSPAPGRGDPISTIGDVLDSASANWAERVALVDGEHRCTYGELQRRARNAAGAFIELGVRKGDRVALCLPNGLDWAIAFFGAAYAGAVVVALNTALSAPELEYQVSQSGASVLVVRGEYRKRDYLATARQIRDAVDTTLTIVAVDGGDRPDASDDVLAWDRLIRTAPAEASLPALSRTDPAIMLYTSGTTGRPKGAVHTHSFVMMLSAGIEHLRLSERDVLVLYLPLFHIYALVAGLLMWTRAGARLILMERFHAAESLRLIEQERATVMYGIPTTYIDQLNDPALETTDLATVRMAFTPLAYDLCCKVRDTMGVVCLNPYGMTETAALVMVADPDDPPEIALRTVGRPLAGMEARIVDETSGVPVPSGTPGALLMRGPSILSGYHELPQATADAFDGDGWFRTGDMASMDDTGNVTFIGRSGDSYRVGGEIVDPVEVEAVLQSHPDVLRAAALGVPDERLGEVGHAWVQVCGGAGVAEDELRERVAAELASFKVPRQVHFVTEFPTTPSGKIQKFRLRDSLLAAGE